MIVTDLCQQILIIADFDEANYHVRETHMAMEQGWPPANSQKGNEVLSPILKKQPHNLGSRPFLSRAFRWKPSPG